MDSDQGKLFIGGISWETTEDKLSDYFGNYGDVLQTVVMRDKMTGKPRGFGFVVFADPSIVDRVIQDTHTIDGRTVEAKRAMSREEQHTISRSGNSNMARNAGGGGNGGGGGNIRTKKIFVGGLPPTLSEMEFREYFEAFGVVTDVVVMYDQNTQRPRGFGFVSFDSEDSVDHVVQKQYHDVGGKAVEVKRALPKDANSSGAGNRSGGGGSYQSYGGSGANASSYDNRMDAGRYMQPAGIGAGYNPYGSSGYGAPAYGYGAATNNVGYGGQGGGYGSNGAYGNPSGPSSGAPRSPWNTQAPTGYGTAGYGATAGYGGAGSWNTPGSGGPGSGNTGQSPGYGNQGYGYGGTEGPYANQAGYGAAGGRGGGGLAGNSIGSHGEQGGGAGFMSGGGYSDGNGNTGYSNTWRVDPAQGGGYGTGQVNAPGGAIGYGGGYGASQSRQSQQQ